MKNKKPSLAVKIGDIKFKNPVLVASGTFGYASEFDKFYDVRKLGGIVTKTLTYKPRIGNPPQRVYETPSGMLNAIGLQNVGAEVFIKDKLPYLSKLKIPIVVSVMGYSIEEFENVVRILDKEKHVSGFELNLSCPNVKYSSKKSLKSKMDIKNSGLDEIVLDRPAKMFAHDHKMIHDVVQAVRKITRKTIIAKLGPDVSDVGKMAISAEKGGADAISLINTFIAMAIDVNSRKPYLKNRTGGLSGPCIRPIAIRMVWEVQQTVNVPVIGVGGIMDVKDALEFFIAGASCIQVGTANFINPTVCPEIIDGLEKFLKKNKIKSILDLVGSIQEP